MNEMLVAPDPRTRKAVRRLLIAVDRSVEAAREVEAARAALERASRPALHLVGAVDDAEGQTDGNLGVC